MRKHASAEYLDLFLNYIVSSKHCNSTLQGRGLISNIELSKTYCVLAPGPRAMLDKAKAAD